MLRFVALILLLAVHAHAAFGWGPSGHRMVGQIASWRLSDSARIEVRSLLAGASLAEVSTWADEIREDPEWQWLSPYHYLNLDPKVGRFEGCPPQGCVIDGIREALETLGDRSRTSEDRAVALRQLVHFVGDLHQPLHVSHAADRGGNDIEIDFFGEPSNLHRVWDSGILSRRRQSWRRLSRRLVDHLPVEASGWKGGESMMDSVVDWAHESYRLSVEVVYPNASHLAVGRSYVAAYMPLVEKRVLQAGVRLAWLIESVLVDQESAPRERP